MDAISSATAGMLSAAQRLDNAAVLKTADKMMGALLDMRV
jgi:hypothetical protein